MPSHLPPTLPSGRWRDLTTTDFMRIDRARTIAVLPVAAIEQHGPHLPLGTDAMINEGIVAEALRRLPREASVLVLPALEVGDSLEHTAFAGTLSADLDSLLNLWLSVGRGVTRAGLHKLVILNSHGGQRAHVDLAAVRLRAAHGLLVVRAGKTRYTAVDKLLDQMPKERLLGIVLNRTDEQPDAASYYYQQRYYNRERRTTEMPPVSPAERAEEVAIVN